MIIDKKNGSKNFFMFVIGMLFCSIAINLFYVPNNIVATGSTGLSILISKCINVDLSIIIFAISSVMLILGFSVFGIEYGTKNILGTIFYPIFVKASSLFVNFISFDDTSLFLLVVIGASLMGLGFGIIRRSGYNLGGFNFLYDLLYKELKISIGKANILCNFIIILFSLFVFGTNKCIYAMIALYVSSIVADKVILGISRNKAFYIVTRRPLLVRDYIVNNLNYTVTIVNARGGYSNKKKKMLICVIPTIKYCEVKEVIKEIDNSAFFLITDSYFVSK